MIWTVLKLCFYADLSLRLSHLAFFVLSCLDRDIALFVFPKNMDAVMNGTAFFLRGL